MKEDDQILRTVRNLHRQWAAAPVLPSWEVRSEEVARLAGAGLKPAHALIPADIEMVAIACRERCTGSRHYRDGKKQNSVVPLLTGHIACHRVSNIACIDTPYRQGGNDDETGRTENEEAAGSVLKR